MRIAAFLLVGMAMVATAEAQTGPARFGLQPMPNTLPILLFAPDPLAGTLLRPLTGPTGNATLAEVRPEPALLPVAAAEPAPDVRVADTVPESWPQAEALLEPESVAEPESVPEPETAAVPESVPEPEGPAGEAAVEPAPTPAEADPQATTVTVIVENVETSTGTVNVAVCDKSLSREGCPYVREVKAERGFVETEFDGIPPGTYAVVGYHDVNGNNLFDKLLGMPREPYALSSKAGDKLVPSFTDAALPIKAGENAIIIRLKRLGG